MADRIVLQFSTSAPSRRFVWVPFTKGWPNRYSKAIRVLGHTYFSHVDFVLEDGSLLGASNNPQAPVIAGSPVGVAIRPHDYQSFGIRRQMVIRTDRADAILEWAKGEIGKPFDSGALSPRVFLSDPFYGEVESRDWRQPDKWFCAELVICALEGGGYWGPGVKTQIKKNRVTPEDLHLILMMDANVLNRATFFDLIPTFRMGADEI